MKKQNSTFKKKPVNPNTDTKGVIAFLLKKIVTEEFAIIEEAYNKDSKIELETKMQIGSIIEDRTIVITPTFEFQIKDIPFLILKMSCNYVVRPDEWEKIVNDDLALVNVLPQFIGHIISLTIGTARGILHEKTKNTPFSMFILPMMDATAFVPDDLQTLFTESTTENISGNK